MNALFAGFSLGLLQAAHRQFAAVTSALSAVMLLAPRVGAQKSGMPPRLTGERALEAANRLDYLFDGETAIV